MVDMLSKVKIDSPAGCTMVAGTLDGASDPSATLDDAALVSDMFLMFFVAKYYNKKDVNL